MSEEVEQLEPVTEQIEAEDGQTEQTEGQEEQPEAAPAKQAEPSLEDRIAKLLDERLNPVQQRFSKYDSELGQLRKLRSQFDRLNKQDSQPTPPASWTQLPGEQQQATKELVKHLVQELYGDKFQTWDQQVQMAEQQGQIRSTYERAQQLAGPDFEKLNPVLGELFTEYKNRAAEGDEDALDMVENVHTRAGLRGLIAEAKERLAKGQESRAEQVETKRSDRAKKAGTSVNGASQVSPQWSADNLPKDRAERMKVIDDLLKGQADG
jgi:hypothetical protein